jgi:hypothetical protein
LTEFIAIAQQSLGPETMAQYLNMEEALRRLAASASIDTTNLVKTPEQLQEEAAAAQQQQQQAQQQELLMAGIKSPAAAHVAENFTQQGAPYGPQFPAGVNPGDPNAVPNTLPSPVTEAGEPSGPVAEG